MINLILINITQEYTKSSAGTAHKELYGSITSVFSMTIWPAADVLLNSVLSTSDTEENTFCNVRFMKNIPIIAPNIVAITTGSMEIP